MEEKRVSDQEQVQASPEETVSASEPEATEVPLVEALVFTREDALPNEAREEQGT